MRRQTYLRVERVVILAIMLGIVGMFQPWELELYHYGFVLLLFATLTFIVLSHLPVSADED